MEQYTTPLALAQKLISLPSYVSPTQNELPALEFLEQYAAAWLPRMTTERQYLDGSDRYNLIIKGANQPKLLVLGHIDTVQPKEGWATNPLDPTLTAGRLYGLGSSDMKSSLAAFLWALARQPQSTIADDVMILVYVDEEYDFQGMQRFVADKDTRRLAPSLTLSLDGDLEPATGCRGVIELNLTIKGKSGHASSPANGINVITSTVAALQDVTELLGEYDDPALGSATTNLAALRGGTMNRDTGTDVWQQEGNVIPDIADVVFEVRTPLPQVNAALVLALIKRCLGERGLSLAKSSVRHDIRPWPVVYEPDMLAMLQSSYEQAGVPFVLSDRKLTGYIDAQMVAEVIPSPTIIIGTGGRGKHGANESVAIADIDRAARLYGVLLQRLLS